MRPITRRKWPRRTATLSFVVVVLVAIAVLTLVLPTVTNKQTSINSLAILPFVNASADPNIEYLCDGITDTTINSLSQLRQLRVMARGTVFTYKGKQVDPRKVGRDLKVDAVVTGSIYKQGDALIVRADLVDVANGMQLWGEQYNRHLSDILVLQSDLSREISGNLRLKLASEEQRRMTKHHTENIEAYQLYLKGRHFWNKVTEEANKKAIDYFQDSIEKDPGYALAYCGLADCYAQFAIQGWSHPKVAWPKARSAASRALELDNALAEAHTSLAVTLFWYDWNWQKAEQEFKRAIELTPNSDMAHRFFSEYLVAMGRTKEALSEIRRAQELDPLSLQVSEVAGWAFHYARQYDQAIRVGTETIELDQNYALGYMQRGEAYLQKGMAARAMEDFQMAIRISGRYPYYLADLGYAYAKLGKTNEGLAVAGMCQPF